MKEMAMTRVKKSRKEYVCSKCGKTIPVGSEYLRGDLNFSKPIIRCTRCGLQSWEVTTSDFQLRAGEIVYNWSENYDADAEGCQSIIDELDDLRSELEDRLENMPESLQESETGQLLQERIDGIQEAQDALENIDWPEDMDEDEEREEEDFDGEQAINDALSCIPV